MSRIIAILALVLSTTAVFAGKGDITIKGNITNPLDDKVVFTYVTYDKGWLDFREQTVEEPLDAKGNFMVMLPLSHKHTLIAIQNGEQATELYGSPEDKIKMFVDASDFDASLKYEGVGMKADVANYMAKHVLKYGLTQSIYLDVREAMMKSPDEFVVAMDKLMQRELDFLIEEGMSLPQSFVEFWNANYEYLKYEQMLSYPYIHEALTNKSYDMDNLPAENYTVINRVPEKFDDKFLYIGSYRRYCENYYYQQIAAEGVKSDNPYFRVDKVIELSRDRMPKQSAEYVYAAYISRTIKSVPIVRTEQLYETFDDRYHNSQYADYLVDQVNKKKRLAPGSPAIDFTVMSADGEKLKLSELKGKVVYLDFWASWCGPCKREFPYTEKLKEHFAGQDVAFVYVSIDEDKEAWEKAIEQYKLIGYHTREGGWNSDIASDYGVKSVPSYFLIDKEGNFALESTPRPSSGDELKQAIESLL